MHPAAATKTATFSFECPACRTRLSTTAAQRGTLVRCPQCAVDFPAPCFRLHAHDRCDHGGDEQYAFHCGNCGQQMSGRAGDALRRTPCPRCRRILRQPLPPWRQWGRPVARFLTKDDLRRSLRDWMVDYEREFVDDSLIPERGRRRFEYWCGVCGVLHESRVWDIATQMQCSTCQTRLVIPRPYRPPRRGAGPPPVPAIGTAEARFCPQCGRHAADADPSHSRWKTCRRCGTAF